MQISASVKSKVMKRGSEKKLAKLLTKLSKKPIDPDLRDMVGNLELNATWADDFFLLKELYGILKGSDYGGGGRILLFDKTGTQVMEWQSPYPLASEPEEIPVETVEN